MICTICTAEIDYHCFHVWNPDSKKWFSICKPCKEKHESEIIARGCVIYLNNKWAEEINNAFHHLQEIEFEAEEL